MSGICGLISLDGANPKPEDLAAMAKVLGRRGPDGTNLLQLDTAGLGHTLLATTPESLFETLPYRDTDSGATITADVRLDNREELLAKLALDGQTATIGDGELILRAYLAWGDTCLDHLLGDFAFAIWDPRNMRLFCARDQLGVRQLIYYHQPNKVFAFATEPAAILAVDAMPRDLNEGRIADFLYDDLEGIDFTSTFYEQLFRLPPAHSLTLDESGLALRRYWTLTPGPELKLPSDEAYAKAFLDVFTKAVHCRLRSPTPVGSMLSGGMDSGSVVAVASRLLADEGLGPLETFSAVGPDPQTCIETKAAFAAMTMPDLNPHVTNYAELGSLMPELLDLNQRSEEPFDAQMVLPRAVYLMGHRAGVKVMLDGVAGDVVLGHGIHIARLLRAGKWRQALQNVRGEKRFWGHPFPIWKALLHPVWTAFVPESIRRSRHRFLEARGRQRSTDTSLLHPDFARKVGLTGRIRTYRKTFGDLEKSSAEDRAGSIVHTHLAVARERYDRVASCVAIEPRDPFMDLRVVEFCLSLPADQLLSDGWPKMILRRSMAGKLPDQVRWRFGKQHLGGDFIKTLFLETPDLGHSNASSPHALRQFIKPEKLLEAGQGEWKDDSSRERLSIISFANWVRIQASE
ncbi:asparagine synthase-related protein [Falsihalocynthiibacter sp. S25ZX9]|uniref:asparagine synthase-related protein n=1 Tax=Falsihalocynthiibacter sp. S25ZX9 TaxID=3240870 RepID=UPI0035109844